MLIDCFEFKFNWTFHHSPHPLHPPLTVHWLSNVCKWNLFSFLRLANKRRIVNFESSWLSHELKTVFSFTITPSPIFLSLVLYDCRTWKFSQINQTFIISFHIPTRLEKTSNFYLNFVCLLLVEKRRILSLSFIRFPHLSHPSQLHLGVRKRNSKLNFKPPSTSASLYNTANIRANIKTVKRRNNFFFYAAEKFSLLTTVRLFIPSSTVSLAHNELFGGVSRSFFSVLEHLLVVSGAKLTFLWCQFPSLLSERILDKTKLTVLYFQLFQSKIFMEKQHLSNFRIRYSTRKRHSHISKKQQTHEKKKRSQKNYTTRTHFASLKHLWKIIYSALSLSYQKVILFHVFYFFSRLSSSPSHTIKISKSSERNEKFLARVYDIAIHWEPISIFFEYFTTKTHFYLVVHNFSFSSTLSLSVCCCVFSPNNLSATSLSSSSQPHRNQQYKPFSISAQLLHPSLSYM